LQFFKEEVLLPYRIELVEIFNYNIANNYIDFKKQSKEDFNEKKNLHIRRLLFTLTTYFAKYQLFSTFFVVKYNPVSQ